MRTPRGRRAGLARIFLALVRRLRCQAGLGVALALGVLAAHGETIEDNNTWVSFLLTGPLGENTSDSNRWRYLLDSPLKFGDGRVLTCHVSRTSRGFRSGESAIRRTLGAAQQRIRGRIIDEALLARIPRELAAEFHRNPSQCTRAG